MRNVIIFRGMRPLPGIAYERWRWSIRTSRTGITSWYLPGYVRTERIPANGVPISGTVGVINVASLAIFPEQRRTPWNPRRSRLVCRPGSADGR